MKYGYLLILFTSLFFASCTQDEATSVTEQPQGKMVQKTVHTSWSGETVTSVWKYQRNRIESILGDNGSEQYFTYHGDLIVQIDNSNEFGETSTDYFTYDNQNRIISHLNTNASWGRRDVYEYQADGTVVVTKYFGTDVEQNQQVMHAVMLFENGEIVHTKMLNLDSGYSRTCDYTYDGKNSPTHNILGYDKIAGLFNSNQKGIAQNVLSYTQLIENGGSANVTKNFTYDADNYPTQVISNDPLDGDSGTTQYYY